MIRVALFTANDTIAGAETKGAGEKSVTTNNEKATKVCKHMMWLPKIRADLKQKNSKTTSTVSA